MVYFVTRYARYGKLLSNEWFYVTGNAWYSMLLVMNGMVSYWIIHGMVCYWVYYLVYKVPSPT